jgi:hypothetical protein
MTTFETQTSPINLRQLIGKLIANYQPLAVTQKSFFINEVSPALLADTSREVLGNLLNSVFYFVARCCNEACISVYATTYDDRVAVNIKDTSDQASYGVLYEFQHLQLLAKQIGGFLEINNYRNKETIITFNFENQQTVANTIVKQLKIA